MMGISKETGLIFQIVFSVVVAMNVFGNTVVCLVVRRFSFMKTPMNYLLVHLAVCDMLTGLFFLLRRVVYFHFQLSGDTFSHFFCGLVSVVWLVSVTGTYTLVAIALERYKAITKPLAPRMSNKKLKIACALSWFMGAILWIPTALGSNFSDQTKGCETSWKVSWGNIMDGVLWLVLIGIVPSVLMSLLYGKVIHILWFSNTRPDDVSQRCLLQSRKRVTKIALILTIVLFVCWMPNAAYYSYVTLTSEDAIDTQDDLQRTSPISYQTSLVLILLNSSVNPYIYALQDSRFRRCMKSLLCGRFVKDEEQQQSDHTSARLRTIQRSEAVQQCESLIATSNNCK